ncbi:MAG: signal peptidase II [Patescibacteria group bacterium]
MLGLAAALLAFLADRVMKTLALSENGRGAFVFKATLNSGAVFGLPIPTPAIAAISALVMAGILVFALRSRSPLGDAGAAFVLLGGLSNLIDRIRLGAVVDIFSVGLVPLSGVLATFNVSDMMVVLGALLILRSQRRRSTP